MLLIIGFIGLIRLICPVLPTAFNQQPTLFFFGDMCLLIFFNLLQSRLPVTVMPRADAASRIHEQRQMTQAANNGCRVGARHDGYRVPRMKAIQYDYYNYNITHQNFRCSLFICFTATTFAIIHKKHYLCSRNKPKRAATGLQTACQPL